MPPENINNFLFRFPMLSEGIETDQWQEMI